MTKQEKIDQFDINGAGLFNNQLFGLPFNFEESDLVILPVPWEVTVSFNSGTAKGPQSILEASYQVDLFDFDHPGAWEKGIYFLDISPEILDQSNRYRLQAKEIIYYQEKGGSLKDNPVLLKNLENVNNACKELNKWVLEQASTILHRKKKIGMIGGDHSTALGMIQAVSNVHGNFGVLQIDAHADLRVAYESFEYSHASIMHNVLQNDKIEKVVQVGIRDICHAEKKAIETSNGRIESFIDQEMKERLFDGDNWSNICEDIIGALPDKVYITFDIDGLQPNYCPATGTPVPGGLDFTQAIHLLRLLHKSGKQIVGFDLCETGNQPWDGNVGARLLYKLCILMLVD